MLGSSLNTLMVLTLPPSPPCHSHDPGTAVVAFKYVRQYGDDVHRAWAEEGLAPRLLRYTPLVRPEGRLSGQPDGS